MLTYRHYGIACKVSGLHCWGIHAVNVEIKRNMALAVRLVGLYAIKSLCENIHRGTNLTITFDLTDLERSRSLRS